MLVAKNVLAPVAIVEERTGLTIDTIEDVPDQLRQQLLGGDAGDGPYSIVEVGRQIPTVMVYSAGQNVYLLNDGQCSYAMKFYTSQTDPELTDEAVVAELGERFTELPENYRYEVRVLDEDLVIADVDGLQYVIVDEFGNSYDRFDCQTDAGSASNS